MQKHQLIGVLLLLIVLLVLSLSSCLKENKEDLFPYSETCDTIGLTYDGAILLLLTSNRCLECHAPAVAFVNGNGIMLEPYNNILFYVNNGTLVCAVNHDDGCEPMPKDLDKISACSIKKIEIWVNEGAPEN